MAGIRVISASPRIGTFTLKNAETISVGDMLLLTSNEAAIGTSGDGSYIGVALETVDNTADGEVIRATIDPFTVYAYRDGTAHAAGAQLDLNAAGDGLAADSNHDFTVIEDNTASEDTKFIVTPGNHYLHLTG